MEGAAASRKLVTVAGSLIKAEVYLLPLYKTQAAGKEFNSLWEF